MPLIRKDPVAPSDPPDATAEQAAAALRNGDAEQRWSAARTLEAHPSGIPILAQALSGETDPRVREAIFTSLVRLGPQSVEAIIPHLRSDDSGLRTGALDALREMRDAVRAHLPALLADPDPDIRLLSCELVREVSAGEATDLLCSVLDREAEANVCAAAVDVLAEIGEKGALPALARCGARFRDNGFLAFAIDVASKRIAAQGASS